LLRERRSACKTTIYSHLHAPMRVHVFLHVVRANRLAARLANDVSVLAHL
jgi:hypothetical protein